MKKSFVEKRAEQDKLLMEVFIVGKTEEEIQNGYLNYELIKNSLIIMKNKSLMRRKVGQHRDIENLLDSSLNQRIELGIMPKRQVGFTDISSVTYNFNIKYIKSKGSVGKKRHHTDERIIVSESKESARLLLGETLKRLNESLIEISSIYKSIHSVTLMSGERVPYYLIEIVDDRETTAGKPGDIGFPTINDRPMRQKNKCL